jgi:hypothetical protein
VSDHETSATISLSGPVGVCTIEQVLAELLDEFDAAKGFDVVLATIPVAGEAWSVGLKSDHRLRECLAKAGKTARAEGLRHVSPSWSSNSVAFSFNLNQHPRIITRRYNHASPEP